MAVPAIKPPNPRRTRSAHGDLLSPKTSSAAAECHRAWVLALRQDFNQRVSRASISSEIEPSDETHVPRFSRLKRSSLDLSSWDVEGYGVSESGSDLGTTDEELAATLRAALGLEEDHLVRAAINLAPPTISKPTVSYALPDEHKSRAVERHKTSPPKMRRKSMAPTYRGPQLRAAESIVHEEWVATPLPPLLHRQSMPDLNRYVRQKTKN
eukprot:scaffold69547_cov26-Tisochrysis_lutea.AAC.1